MAIWPGNDQAAIVGSLRPSSHPARLKDPSKKPKHASRLQGWRRMSLTAEYS
jgi:hypothetical protein